MSNVEQLFHEFTGHHSYTVRVLSSFDFYACYLSLNPRKNVE